MGRVEYGDNLMSRLKPRYLPASEYDLRGLLRVNDPSDAAAEYNRILLQEACDQLAVQSASPGPSEKISLPRWPIYIDRPIMVSSNTTIEGVRGTSTTHIAPKYTGGPAFVVAIPSNASPHGPALMTGEDYSLDIESASEGSGPDYVKRVFDYGGQLGIQPRNWTSLRLEFSYQLKSAAPDTSTLFMLGGRRTSAEGYKIALCFRFSGNQLICELRISPPGVDPTLTAVTFLVVPTPSVVGTTYHVCIDWNGTTAKLWHATPGTVMAAPVASAALSGVFHTRYYEHLVLGSAGYIQFPDPLPEAFAAAPAYVSGHVFSSVSKRQAGYTAPTAAYTPAADDWLTFVCLDTNEIALSANYPTYKGVYRVNMLGGRLGYHRLVRSTYNVIHYVTIKDVTINGIANGLGMGIVGILASGSIDSHFERVHTLYCGQGVALQNNCYLSRVMSCDFIGGKVTWPGMPTNGQRCARVGFSIGGASGVCIVSKLKIQGFGYGFASSYGSFEGESIWVIESYECKALFNQLSTMSVRSLLLADEGEQGFEPGMNENDYSLILEISSTGQAINFEGLSIECGNTFRDVTPVGLSGGEYRTQVTINGMHAALHSPVSTQQQPEVFHCFNETFKPIQVNSLVTVPAAANITLSPGKVVRDGLASPRALTDSNQTIYWYQGVHRTVPTLTADRTIVLDDVINIVGDPTPYDGARISVFRKSAADAFTCAFTSGSGGQVIYTFPVSQIGAVGFMYQRSAARMSGAPTLTFNAAGDTVTRGAGSWLTEGFEVGDLVTFFTPLNRYSFRVSALTGTVMTIAGATVVDEVTAAAAYVFASRWIVAP